MQLTIRKTEKLHRLSITQTSDQRRKYNTHFDVQNYILNW